MAAQRGKVGRNVVALVQAPSTKPKKAAKSFSEADVDVLFVAMHGDRYEARWHLALQFGLRPGEAIAIEWSDVDLDAKTMRVHQQLQQIKGKGLVLVESPKSESGDRILELPDYLVELLRARRAHQLAENLEMVGGPKVWEWEVVPRAFVFTQHNGAPLRPRLDATNWTRLLASAGIAHASRYTARHTAGSMMISYGIDAATVSSTMGHGTPAFTMSRYVHPVDERKAGLAAMLASRAEPHLEDKVLDKVQAARRDSDERLASQ